ncbi:hypothetical protein NHJ6243_001400 [Beauveria neobassiana]
MFSQNPIVFIVCIIGLAFVATMIWLGFYLIRHRPYFAKPGDAEQAVVYANTARAYSTPDHGGSQQHPPVYCADDIACPPPSYEAIFRRDTAPTPHEVHVLRHRLEKFHCHRRRSSSSPADTAAACETAIRDSQIRDLAQWTDRSEMLRDDGEQDDGDAPALSRRRTVCDRFRPLSMREVAKCRAAANAHGGSVEPNAGRHGSSNCSAAGATPEGSV